MKSSIKMVTVCACLLLPLSNTFAEPDQAPPKKKFNKLVEKLELDVNQQDAFRTIMTEQRQKKKILKSEHRKTMQALRAETLERLQPVLTEDQVQKLKTIFENRHKNKKKHSRLAPEDKAQNDK